MGLEGNPTIILSIIGTAIALAAVILMGQRNTREQIGDLRGELRQSVSDLRGELQQSNRDIQQSVGELRERMTRVEVLFEGFTKGDYILEYTSCILPQSE